MRGLLGILALAVLLCAVGAVRAGVAAGQCPGDCGRDGMVGVDDLIEAVVAALGGPLRVDCAVDLDGDGAVAIDELVRLVGLALNGCAPLLDAGVYDIDARGQSDPSGGFNRAGVVVLEPSPGGASGELYFGLLESYFIGLAAQPDGSVALSGSGVTGGDIVVTISGSARLTQHDDVVELGGILDVDTFIGGAHLDFVARRPRAGTPAAYGGTYQVALQHPESSPSRLDLPVSVPPSGMATCAAAQDRSLDGAVLAELAAASCVVSPSGRFRYLTPYDAPGRGDLPLQMWGTLSADPGVITRGMYYIAAFPIVDESGAWQAEHLLP